MKCLFCKIINKEIPADFVYEDDLVVVFKDIAPKAEVHLLMVPKKHIHSTKELNDSHKDLLLHIFETLPKVADSFNLESGFRTIVNTGEGGGQTVFHLHFHLLGGKLPSM